MWEADEEQLRLANAENQLLIDKNREVIEYVRNKVDQLLTVIGTIPLKPDELDDDTLINLDPIGIISNTFIQILEHLSANDRVTMTEAQSLTGTLNSTLKNRMRVLIEKSLIVRYGQGRATWYELKQ